MPFRIVAILLLTLNTSVSAQIKTHWYLGEWSGALSAFGSNLTLTFTVKDSWEPKAFLAVPAQGVSQLPASECRVSQQNLELAFTQFGIRFSGQYDGDSLRGTFSQSGYQFPLSLKQKDLNRFYQTPKAPFPYQARELQFFSLDKRIRFSGAFTYPKGPIKACIVLFSGSGAQDRDQRIGDHVPFAFWADTFTRLGYAVLRVDDRGAGFTIGQSTALEKTRIQDLFDDGKAYVQAMKNQPESGWSDSSQGLPIYLMGHSQGAGIAIHLLSQGVEGVAGAIGLAPWAYSGRTINREQNALSVAPVLDDSTLIASFLILHDSMVEWVLNTPHFDSQSAQYRAQTLLDQNPQRKELIRAFRKKKIDLAPYLGQQYVQLSGFMTSFMKHDPSLELSQIEKPMLWVQGTADRQVNPQRIEELARLYSNIECQMMTGYNHLLQPCQRCTFDEYFELPVTVGDKAVQAILNWLQAQNP